MTSVLARYDALVKAGELRPDPDQRAAAERLGITTDGLDESGLRAALQARLSKD